MHVGAAAGLPAVGLGHEGGLEAVPEGHALDQALEQHGAVAGRQGVVAVDQVDLELARGALLEGGVQRQALEARRRLDLLEEVGVFVELADRVELAVGGALAAGRRAGRLDHAQGVARPVDQVELHLHGHHRRQARPAEALEHPGQHLARVGEEGGAVGLGHGHQQLGLAAVAQPGTRHQGARHRAADPVGVAAGQPQPGLLDGVAEDVQGEHRGGQVDPVAIGLLQVLAGDALAALHAVEVADQQVDAGNVGVTFQEVTGFVDGKGRHDDTCVLGCWRCGHLWPNRSMLSNNLRRWRCG